MSFLFSKEETNKNNIYRILGIKITVKKREFKALLKTNPLYTYKKNKVDITQIPKATGMLRDIQLANLEILKELDYVCKSNGLTYWLDFGTLLGAVRHKGFIPWDDDIDVGMTRESYDKIIDAFNSSTRNPDLYAGYFRSTLYRTNYYIKIMHKKCPNLFVDIFPYDYLSVVLNDNEQIKMSSQIKKLRNLFADGNKTVEDDEELNQLLKELRGHYSYSQPYENSDLIWGCDFNHYWKKWIHSQNTIFPLKDIEFEGIKLPCMNDTHKYLTDVYGNYMSYPKKIKMQHYWDKEISEEEYEEILKSGGGAKSRLIQYLSHDKKLIINLFGIKISISFDIEKIFFKIINKKIIRLFDFVLPKDRNRVVFFFADKRENNSLAYYNYLKENYSDKYELCVVKPENLKTFKSVFLMYTSKYVIFTHCNVFVEYFKSKRHIYLNLWHGMPIKTLGFNEDILPEFMLKRYKFIGENSVMFATSDLFKQFLIPCFKIDYHNVYITGQSRTDVINSYKNDDKIKMLFDIGKYKKTVLYLPTWKASAAGMKKQVEKDFNNIFYMDDYNNEDFIKTIEDNNILFIMKPHPLEEKFYIENPEVLPKSKNFRVIFDKDLRGMDIYESFKYVDLMISDYSSVTIDYLLLNRPILYIDSLSEDYASTRGMILEDNYRILMPGVKVKTYKDFKVELTDNLEYDKYKDEREKVLPLIHKYMDYNANERIFKIMENL